MQEARNKERSTARLVAVQALYQMETASVGVERVIQEFLTHRFGGDIEGVHLHEADAALFADIVRGVTEIQRRIDSCIERRLAKGWTLARLDATARAILRAAVYELTRRTDIPFRVVIDEYLEIANAFFDGDEPRFINGALDAIARDARPDEAQE